MRFRDPKKSLFDIIDAINRIQLYLKGVTRDDFFMSFEKQDAVIRQLGIIGEAANRIPHTVQDQILIPWSEIIEMRNILIHDYEGVSIRVVWETVEHDLLLLKTAIEQYLQK